MKKTLVAYFSAGGETKKVAEKLSKVVDAELYEIKPAVPYSSRDLNWNDKNSRSSIEMNNPMSRPEIEGSVSGFEQYSTIFIGFPIWWYVAPTIINTFLESYDFTGKKVITFCTSGGSGLGNSDKILKECCSNSVKWIPGKRFSSAISEESIVGWVKELGL